MAQTDKTKEEIVSINDVKRIVNAIIKRIEGNDDPRHKYDYLTKPDTDNIKTMSVLAEGQVDSVAECSFLGASFPSLYPLASLSTTYAAWSPSKQGKRADQLTATMIQKEQSIIPTVLTAPTSNKKEKKKEEKQDGT